MTAVDSETEPGFAALVGYLTGWLTVNTLEAAGQDLTRDSFLAAFGDKREVDFDGVTMRFGPGDNQGMEGVFLTRITRDGSVLPNAVGGESRSPSGAIRPAHKACPDLGAPSP